MAAPEEGTVADDEGEEARAAGLEAPDEILEQMLQVCEQDMDTACGAVAELSRDAMLVSKWKREEELDGQPVRHSLWEQGSLEPYNEVLFGNLDGDVEALQQRKAVYDEERKLSEGSDSCWSNTGSDSDSTEIEVDIEPIALEGAVVAVIQGGEEEIAAVELAGKRKRKNELAQQPMRHSLWEQGSLEAHNEVLSGHLEGEVRALKQRRLTMMRQGGCLMGVTPAGVTRMVTQATRKHLSWT